LPLGKEVWSEKLVKSGETGQRINPTLFRGARGTNRFSFS
jgi:hypothetical protein